MEKLLVKYDQDFYYGIMSGLFITTKEELETLNGREVYYCEALGKY